MKKIITLIIIIVVILAVGFLGWKYLLKKDDTVSISSFEECEAKGYPIQESYPRKCSTPDNRTFTEDIGNALEKKDFIVVQSPRPNAKISSPLQIMGEARGFWFFEASFPVKMMDENGNDIEVNPTFIQAQGDWMTEDFVPFQATIEFEKPSTKKGILILEKDNPSGLPENADKLIIPVTFD